MIPLSSPTSVLLAGGGSAGHVSPLLALADALRAPPPRPAGDGARHAGGPRGAPRAGPRLRPERSCPRCRCRAARAPTCCACPGASRRPSTPPAPPSTRPVPRSSSASAATSARPPTSRPGAATCRSSSTSRTPVPGLANRLGARWASAVATTFSSTSLPHAQRIGMPLRREVAHARPCGRCAPRRSSTSACSPQWPTVLVTGGSLGAQRLNDAFRARVTELSRGGRPGAARDRARQGVRPRAPAEEAPRTSSCRTPTAWSWRMPPPTSSSRARAPTRCAS